MKSLFFILCSLIAVPFVSFGQIEMESERDNDGIVTLYAINRTSIPHTVLINFSQLQNMTTPGGGDVTALASPGRSRVATLKPTLSGQGTNYRYSYSYVRGNLFAKSKTKPLYLIPVEAGQEVVATQMNPLADRLTDGEKTGSYVGVSFSFSNPTMIVAPRKGIVSDMKMDYEGNKENLSFNRAENFIELYHEDGTFTKISVLKAGTSRVKEGDLVFPGDILAQSGGENYSSGPHVRMINLRPIKTDTNKLSMEAFPVTFVGENGEVAFNQPEKFQVAHPQAVVTAEMSKKELKAFQEGK
ncbi:M23 family metallopeptidase [Algoriphagus confluentis]|uniref:M23ase beta-sheet core domain-containing protein n=1 Tax=Algoriphagus confluentis TaxID=1697556 RepID=A0ABQ6PPI3_9BACT|nr:hypothetical protein Aconfl_13750 [Algoriphagus confluentis]